VIGGGLAGPEAALTAASLGCPVDLYELRAMVDGKPGADPRPPDHRIRRTGLLQLAQERIALYGAVAAEAGDAACGSALLRIGGSDRRPAGHALAVDRVESPAALPKRLPPSR